jgi:hypothetical protein
MKLAYSRVLKQFVLVNQTELKILNVRAHLATLSSAVLSPPSCADATEHTADKNLLTINLVDEKGKR